MGQNNMAVIINEIPKLLNNPKHTIEPLWADNTGRKTNSGKFVGTFIGWFDKIELNIGSTTYAEMANLRTLLEFPILECTFLDSRTNTNKTELFYGTAIAAERKNSNSYKPTSITLTAVYRRSDM